MTVGVAIVGASGYTGQELVRLVHAHPGLAIMSLHGSSASIGLAYSARCPAFAGVVDDVVQGVSAESIVASGATAALLATPHELSAKLAAELIEAGLVVVDLSGAYRLKDATRYPKHYGFEHPAPELLGEAVYGIPELWRDEIASARLVAAAGCYPTSAVIPLQPLANAGVIQLGTRPVIDSVSGVSGAGRSAVESGMLCEASLRPYGVWSHRHQPEIDAGVGAATVFTPMVGPFERGIVSTMHVELADGVGEGAIRELLGSAYTGEAFVRLLPAGAWPSVRGVERTNFIDIGLAVDEPGGHLVMCSAIDNLLKGASGQAVQCLNLMLGLGETAGLLSGSVGALA